MDARPVALLCGGALALALFLWLQRDLSRAGAGWQPRAVVAAPFAGMVLSWALVFAGVLPQPVAWLATVAAAGVTLVHRQIGDALAGSNARRVAAEVGSIRMELSTLTTSSRERARLRLKARELDNLRSEEGDAEVDELIDLVQELTFERLDGRRNGGMTQDEREERIEELLVELER